MDDQQRRRAAVRLVQSLVALETGTRLDGVVFAYQRVPLFHEVVNVFADLILLAYDAN